jgi:hypothetical protein
VEIKPMELRKNSKEKVIFFEVEPESKIKQGKISTKQILVYWNIKSSNNKTDTIL